MKIEKLERAIKRLEKSRNVARKVLRWMKTTHDFRLKYVPEEYSLLYAPAYRASVAVRNLDEAIRSLENIKSETLRHSDNL